MSRAHRTIDIPLPTARLAAIAAQAIGVDPELSPLVRRTLETTTTGPTSAQSQEEDATVLRAVYSATTNRMLRVAVNSYMESVGLVLDVMAEMDEDVLLEAGKVGEVA